MSELWQRLRQARRFADLTQQDLASKCGVSRGAVALWEAAEPEHRTKPSTGHLLKVAETTGAPIEWLLNDASDVNAIWRLAGEFSGGQAVEAERKNWKNRASDHDVLPDLRQEGHLFVFAQTPEQIARKLMQLQSEPAELNKHLVVVGTAGLHLHLADSPTDALAAVVRQLTTKP